MNYTQYYEGKVTEALDRAERKIWQEFYTKRLPKRTEKFKRKYTGKPEELAKAIEEFELVTAGEYAEVVDAKLTKLCEEMRERFYFDAVNRLDQLSEGAPDKADHPQPLASEIISEINAKLRAAEADRDTFYEQKSVCQMQLDIISYISQITDPIMLKEIYADAKVAHEKQLQEDEEWTTERK